MGICSYWYLPTVCPRVYEKCGSCMRQAMFTLSGAPTCSTISHLDNYILSILHYLQSPFSWCMLILTSRETHIFIMDAYILFYINNWVCWHCCVDRSVHEAIHHPVSLLTINPDIFVKHIEWISDNPNHLVWITDLHHLNYLSVHVSHILHLHIKMIHVGLFIISDNSKTEVLIITEASHRYENWSKTWI